MDLQELKKRIIKSNSTRYTHLLNDGKDFTKSKTQSYERSKHQPRIPVKPHNEKDNTELKQKYNELMEYYHKPTSTYKAPDLNKDINWAGASFVANKMGITTDNVKNSLNNQLSNLENNFLSSGLSYGDRSVGLRNFNVQGQDPRFDGLFSYNINYNPNLEVSRNRQVRASIRHHQEEPFFYNNVGFIDEEHKHDSPDETHYSLGNGQMYRDSSRMNHRNNINNIPTPTYQPYWERNPNADAVMYDVAFPSVVNDEPQFYDIGLD
jgi:hypothetical protein